MGVALHDKGSLLCNIVFNSYDFAWGNKRYHFDCSSAVNMLNRNEGKVTRGSHLKRIIETLDSILPKIDFEIFC